MEAVTANGASTYASSSSALVDLFFLIGSPCDEQEIIQAFKAAYSADPLATWQIVLWGRDARGGAGRRANFRTILNHIDDDESFELNDHIMNTFVHVGRIDDLFSFDKKLKQVAFYLRDRLEDEGISQLVGKWCPRKGSVANRLRSYWGLTPKQYRKLIVSKSNTVEQQMCAKQWDQINYSHVPSVASARYRTAFHRNDGVRYTNWVEKVTSGEAKINAKAIFPHDVLRGINLADKNAQDVADAQWKALPDFMEGSTERILPMCDVSGSMGIQVSGEVTAMDVCIALGLYISGRQTGGFQNKILTFSANPQLHNVNASESIVTQRYDLVRADWGMNTNFEAAFKLILESAKMWNIPQDQMPTTLLVFSDMEFDEAVSTNRLQRSGPQPVHSEQMVKAYQAAGYQVPKIVFWNLNGRINNVPAKANDENLALVSGFSPAIMQAILKKPFCTPADVMAEAIAPYEKFAKLFI